MTTRDGEENQKINDIPVIEERIQNESGRMEPSKTEIHVRVETKITNEEHLIIDELKDLIIRNETEEYLPFKKVDQRNTHAWNTVVMSGQAPLVAIWNC